VKWDAQDEAENRQQDDKLKLSLMATFVRDNKMRCEEINTALESGDIKLAHRIAHTLKSNAGNLGKTKLQKAAENVEYLLKDGKNLVTAEHLSTLEDELAAVLGELVPLVKESAPPPQAQAEPLDAEKTKELFAELKPLLERGNAESLKYIDKLRTIPGTDEPLVRKLIQQMEDLDFEDATETLCELRMRS
jgi:HPt (histidine-containing phosphotransfer) domain-containing protein